MKTFGKRMAGLLAALTAVMLVGTAVAAWVANGTGSGTAKAITGSPLTTLDASGSTTAQLYPGGSGNVSLRINNPNPYPVRVTAVAGNGTITATGGTGTCTITGVSFVDQTGLTLDIAASTATTFTLTAAASMTNASADGCQGAVFTIPISMTGNSNA
jgi:hypothetical protein